MIFKSYIILHLEDLRNEVFIITDGKFYSTKEIFESLSLANNKQILKIHIPMWTLKIVRCLSPKIKMRIDKLLSMNLIPLKNRIPDSRQGSNSIIYMKKTFDLFLTEYN